MEDKRKFRPDPGIKLMDQVWQVLRYHQLPISHREKPTVIGSFVMPNSSVLKTSDFEL